MADHPVPSEHARALVAGAYDAHVHVLPDVVARRIDDIDLARRFRQADLTGFVLKSHYAATAERAAVVRKVVPGVDVLGAITLNGAVGGLNAPAVEIAGRSGARFCWLPTVDSRNQRESRASDPPGATPPMWAALQDELISQGIAPDIVEVVDASGAPLTKLIQVLRVVGRHDMTLATGHLSAAEIEVVVPAAFTEGVQRVVVTHPEFTSQRLPIDVQRSLAAQGALLERCFSTAYTGKTSWPQVLDAVAAVGVEHSVLSSDLGQPANPPVEYGLPLIADRLLEAGFDDDSIRRMAVTNSRYACGAG